MASDQLDLYRRASTWTIDKVSGAASQQDASTTCDEWDVHTLLNHMLETQRFFVASGRGEQASPPSPTPPEIISDDPTRDFMQVRDDMLATFADPAVVEKSGPALPVAFSDFLIHGWDVARATHQDTAMPDGLAEAAYNMIHGKFTDEQRKGLFKPEVPVSANASPQDRLLAYTGRQPD